HLRKSFKYSPRSCNLRRVRLRWLRRALALRSWVTCSCRWIVWARFLEQRPPRHHVGTSWAVAVRTWHSESSEFSPPMFPLEFRKEQVTHAAQDQMTLNGQVFADFKMVQAQFALAILEHAFDLPTAKRHQ